MHYRDQLGVRGISQRRFQPVHFNNSAPFGFNPIHFGPKAAGGISEAFAECSVDRHDDFIAIFDDVG